MPSLRLRQVVAVILAGWVASVQPVSAAPRDELLPLVPSDSAVCFILQDWREHHSRLAKMPWTSALARTALGKAILQAPEVDKLLNADKDVKRFTRVEWSDIRDNILGDCVIFAFHPAQRKEDERGVILLWAKDSNLLAKLLEVVNQKQLESGEIKAIKAREYKAVKYFVRQEGKQEQFYWQHQSLFAFTTHESTLKQVINRHLQQTPARDTRLTQSLERLGSKPAIATLWIDPRAFDEQWKVLPGENNPEVIAAKQAFAPYWRALDAIALTADAGTDVRVSLALQGRSKALPKATQKLLQTAAKPSELWGQFPAKAMLTVVGRADAHALFEALEQFLPQGERVKLRGNLQKLFAASLKLDFVEEVLPFLGPDIGYCVAPSPEGNPIPDMFFAVRVQPGDAKKRFDLALFKGLQKAAALGEFLFNINQKEKEDHIEFGSVQAGGIDISYFSQRQFPKGLRPAFALKNGYLVFASSPEAIGRFGAKAAKVVDAPLLRLSFTELGQVLKKHRTWLKVVANDTPAKDAGKWFDDIVELLALFDNLEIRQDFTPGQALWTVRLQMAKD